MPDSTAAVSRPLKDETIAPRGLSLRELIRAGRTDDAWAEVRRQVQTVDDYAALSRLVRHFRRLRAVSPAGHATTVRLALAGSGSTELLEEPLALAFDAVGLGTDIHRADFDTQAWELLQPDSATVRHHPTVVHLVNTPHSLPAWPGPGTGPADAGRAVDAIVEHWFGLCAAVHDRTDCDVILDNFHPFPVRPLGNHGAKIPWDPATMVARINLGLGERAPAYVHINDVAMLAAREGLRRWVDERYWHLAKQPVSFACLAAYVRNVARIAGALYGRSAKCLVLDLDNTLWGGVIGDDGIDGIAIGPGDAVGEAYAAFQTYVRQLKEQGVLLAVSSKNEMDAALGPFTDRPEMVLQRDDFVAFHANWAPKAESLRRIAAELNIGLDALVFVDDNPVERDQIRRWLPEVRVVELSEDPSEYPRLLDETGWFEVTSISAEDRSRTRQYQANDQRQALQASVTDYDQFLRELDQVAVIKPFESKFLDRITQLINKSNQFNLTTTREHRAEVEAHMRADDTITRYVRMKDRFGDNGLISVLYARRAGDTLTIVQWLMSCRVLNRGVEHALLNDVVGAARRLGVAAIRGVYRPTAKNRLVKDHYAALGFDPVSAADDGVTEWRLAVGEYQLRESPIHLVEDY